MKAFRDLGAIRWWLISTALAIALCAGACGPLVETAQPGLRTERAALQPGLALGQTFITRYRGLHGVEVFIEPGEPATGQLVLYLAPDPQSTNPTAVARLPASEIDTPGLYRFEFSAPAVPAGEYRYIYIQLEGQGSVSVGTAGARRYLDGAMHLDHQPQDAQLRFNLLYFPWQAAAGILGEVITWAGYLAVAGGVFLVPGWAVRRLLTPNGMSLAWPAEIGLWIGIGMALYPLLLLWTELVGLGVWAFLGWLLPLASLAWLALRLRTFRAHELLASLGEWVRSACRAADAAFLLVALAIFISRFLAVRNLAAPMWGDSYQHTLIVQLIQENGGLFENWAPYTQLQSFTYHFGFHSAVAAWNQILGLESPQAVLAMGQILNGLAALALYPLAFKISGSRWAGVAAVLVAGLLNPFPMFYLNWGRYTQLAGQVILPAVLFWMWQALDSRERGPGFHALGALLLAGLGLTHYRVLLMAALFLPVLWGIAGVRRQLRSVLSRTMLSGLGAAVLFTPWLVTVARGKTIDILGSQFQPAAVPASPLLAAAAAFGDLADGLNPLIWGLVALSLAWILVRRRGMAAGIAAWWALLILAGNPGWFGLPGGDTLGNFAVAIAGYFPASLLVGAAAGQLAERVLERGGHRGRKALVLIAVAALTVAGASARLQDLRARDHALVTHPDLRAAEWIQAHTPADSHFLVNAFFAYNGYTVVGSDAGWWLPLLAGRSTTLPPLNYAFERGPSAGYRSEVNALVAALRTGGAGDPQVVEALQAGGVTHVFLGQQRGRVNSPIPLLEPEAFLSSGAYQPLYHQDRVWIFTLCPERTGCGPG